MFDRSKECELIILKVKQEWKNEDNMQTSSSEEWKNDIFLYTGKEESLRWRKCYRRQMNECESTSN